MLAVAVDFGIRFFAAVAVGFECVARAGRRSLNPHPPNPKLQRVLILRVLDFLSA